MGVRVPWSVLLAMAAIVLLALLLLSHLVGYYIQMFVLALVLVTGLIWLVRRGTRRLVYGRRGDRSRTRPR